MINTWKCEICGEERPDEDINVLTYPLKDLPGGERNLKYCNDNFVCPQRAFEKSKTGKV